jgi:thiol-disulfide isomerase/thioredoxin
MKIQVLGTGCGKCKMLTANAEQAVKELDLPVEIEKVAIEAARQVFGP